MSLESTDGNKMTLSSKILIYMMVGLATGVIINLYAKESAFAQKYLVDGLFYILGQVFIESLKMLVVPLVFCSLIGGIVGMNDLKALGRTSGKSMALFMFTTIVAISFGLFLAVSLGIGEGFDISVNSAAVDFTVSEAPAFSQVMIGIIPSNILGAMADGKMLQVIAACVFLGIAIIKAGEKGKGIAQGISNFNHVIMDLVNIVMSMAPFGVFCLIASTFAKQGLEAAIPMMGYFLTAAAALLLHFMGTFSGLFLAAGLNPIRFIMKMRSVVLFAFSSASSNATIPVTMLAVEERLGVDSSVASFVVPLGATINMNGTAIMQGVATVFIANVYGIELSGADYLTVIGMSVLASVGTAGIPGVGLIMLAMVFAQVGLPVEGIALIIGVDRLLDMLRTAVNVTGDAATCCIVAKTEGKLNLDIYNDPNAGAVDAYENVLEGVGGIGAKQENKDA
jgi:Na+/H+-dicarboxylate symporter